jgi:signal transduction histidine kinase
MGLAIVRKVVEHYGGRVGIDPQCQQGLAIEFTLPTAAPRPSTRHGRR